MKKTIAIAISSALLGGGAVFTSNLGATDSVLLTAEKEAKHQVVKDNIWKDVRLGETPEWDASVVSATEMSQAYVEVAKEQGATSQPNLYEGLDQKAVEQGVKCQ
jgi:hypothetical protein